MITPLLIAAILAAAAPPPSDIDRTLSEADRLENEGEYERAIAIYQRLLKGNEGKVLWRISRAFSDMGEAAPADRQESLYDRAIEAGRKAVAAAPRSAEGHTMLAVALGRKAPFAPAEESLKISREMRESAGRAIVLDPQAFIPHIVLGIWNREIAGLGFVQRTAAKLFYGGLPEASLEAGARNLERAVSLNPDSIRAHHELAVTCWEMGEKEKARKEMRQAATRRPNRSLDKPLQTKAKEMLEKFGG